MSQHTIEVHLCWNDDHGNFTGLTRAVEFYDGDLLARLEHDEGVMVELPLPRARHVGNLLWDLVRMEKTQAVHLARYLVSRGFVVIEHASDESPWNSLEGVKS